MRIAVNVRLLIKNRVDGIARFTSETLQRITVQHPEHDFIFYFDRSFSDEFIFSSNITPVVVPPQTRHYVLNTIWLEYTLPFVMKRHKPDLFLSPDGLLSLRSDVPALPVIHDLNFEHYPDFLPAGALAYYRRRFPLFARKALRIATVSEYSAQDIATLYGVDREKIDVVYNGVSAQFRPAAAAEVHATREKYSKGFPYFLFVGSLHPRKNIKNTLLAFDAYRSRSAERKLFVIAGERSYWTSEMQQAFESMKFRDDVIFTGPLSDDVLPGLYAAAHALVYVSLFEGFGIPLLEAMQSEVPVVTSGITSMPEVAGNAALLADPFSVNSISDQLLLLDDPAERERLTEAGKKRVLEFSWDRSAGLLWQSVEKALSVL